MKTKEVEVGGDVAIWAIPNRYAQAGDDPFTYELRTDRPWQDGAVQLYSQEVVLTLPANIDVIRMAVQTLQEAKKEVMSDYTRRLTDLDSRISKLLQLTHNPGGGDVEGNSLEGSATEVLGG